MGKGKPKWKSLPSRERFARKVKSWGFSDSIVNRIRESNNKDKTDAPDGKGGTIRARRRAFYYKKNFR